MSNGKLIDLLRAKEAAQAVYDAACKVSREASANGLSMDDRIKLDIIKQRAVQDSVRADTVYTDALRAAVTDAELAGAGGLK